MTHLPEDQARDDLTPPPERDVEAHGRTIYAALMRQDDGDSGPFLALTALLQHIETLTREKDEAMDAAGLPHTASLADLIRHHRNNQAAADGWKLVAAEAQVETLTRERDEWKQGAFKFDDERRVAEARVLELERALWESFPGASRIVVEGTPLTGGAQ